MAAGNKKRDGVVNNLGTGNDITDRNRWFIRGQLLFQGDSGLKVRIIGDYNKIDELCCGVFSFQQGLATSVLTRPLIGGQVNAPGTAFTNNVYFNYAPTHKLETGRSSSRERV